MSNDVAPVGEAPPFQLERRGVVLRPDPTHPFEQGGVLNPAAVQHDGTTYLFYRAVALSPANYSRILIASTRLEPDGTTTTTRLDRVALEPAVPYELWA